MTWPTLITITDSAEQSPGVPASGYLTFQLNVPIANSSTGAAWPNAAYRVPYVNGVATATVAVTNDSTTEPIGASYTVTKVIQGAPSLPPWTIQPTLAMAPTIALQLIPAVSPFLPVYPYATSVELNAEIVRAEVAEALLASKASPALTGIPTVPTAGPLTNNTQAASTGYADSATAVEKARAQAAESINAGSITAEATARAAADTANANAITSEATTRASADTTNANAIVAETARAQGAESTNAAAITTETTNRTSAVSTEASTRSTADTANATAIANEATTARAAESTNATAITNEATTARAAEALLAQALIPTTVKTANYTAAAADLVPCDTTSGSFTVTLPNAPADKTRVAVKMVVLGGTNTVTVACAGSDVFNKVGGATSATILLLAQAMQVQYKASTHIWYVVADDLPLPQLDGRYDVLNAATAAVAAYPINPCLWGFPAAGSYTGGGGTLLSSKYGTLAAAQAAFGGAYSFVQDLSQTIEWAALQSAVNFAASFTSGFGGRIMVPPGWFGMGGSASFPTSITYPSATFKTIVIEGSTRGSTVLNWGNDLGSGVAAIIRPNTTFNHGLSHLKIQGPLNALTPKSDRWNIQLSGSPTGGTITVAYSATNVTWNYNDTATTVQTALRALGGGLSACTVTPLTTAGGGGWFVDSQVATPTTAVTIVSNTLTGGTSPSFTVGHINTGVAGVSALMDGVQHLSNHVTEDVWVSGFRQGFIIGGNHNEMKHCKASTNWFGGYWINNGTSGNTYIYDCDFTGNALSSWGIASGSAALGGMVLHNIHFGGGPFGIYFDGTGGTTPSGGPSGTSSGIIQNVTFLQCAFESCENAYIYDAGTNLGSQLIFSQFIDCSVAGTMQYAFGATGYRSRAPFDVGFLSNVRFTDCDLMFQLLSSTDNVNHALLAASIFNVATGSNGLVIESTAPLLKNMYPLLSMLPNNLPFCNLTIFPGVSFQAAQEVAELWSTQLPGSPAIPANTLVSESGGGFISGYTAGSNVIGVAMQAAGTGGFQSVPVMTKGKATMASVAGFSSSLSVVPDPANAGYVINASATNPGPYVGWATAAAAANATGTVDIGRNLDQGGAALRRLQVGGALQTYRPNLDLVAGTSTYVTITATDDSANNRSIATVDLSTGAQSALAAAAAGSLLAFCGDGSDGAVTLDGTTTYAGFTTTTGAAPNLVYTLSRSVCATTLSVSAGITINPNGFLLLATTSITNAGTIQNNGGTGAAAGTAGAISNATSSLFGACPGGAGNIGAGATGSYGSAAGPTSIIGAGGAGGLGTGGAGAAATATSSAPGGSGALAYLRSPTPLATGLMQMGQAAKQPAGGAGGGGGGGDGTVKGGGGGAGGGIIAMFSPTITNTGTISATGGAGGTPASGNAGGGGGGGGGLIIAYTGIAWTAGTTSVALGTGGNATGTGVVGSNGANGRVLNVVL